MENDKRALRHTRLLTWTVLPKDGDKVSLHDALWPLDWKHFWLMLCFLLCFGDGSLRLAAVGHLAAKVPRTSLLGCTKSAAVLFQEHMNEAGDMCGMSIAEWCRNSACPPPKPSFSGDKVSLHDALWPLDWKHFWLMLCFLLCFGDGSLRLAAVGHLASKSKATVTEAEEEAQHQPKMLPIQRP